MPCMERLLLGAFLTSACPQKVDCRIATPLWLDRKGQLCRWPGPFKSGTQDRPAASRQPLSRRPQNPLKMQWLQLQSPNYKANGRHHRSSSSSNSRRRSRQLRSRQLRSSTVSSSSRRLSITHGQRIPMP